MASLATVLVGFNSTATNIALDDIQAGFIGATAADIGWGVAGFFIGTAAFLPLAGRLSDRIGRKRIFQLGLLAFALSAVFSATAGQLLLSTSAACCKLSLVQRFSLHHLRWCSRCSLSPDAQQQLGFVRSWSPWRRCSTRCSSTYFGECWLASCVFGQRSSRSVDVLGRSKTIERTTNAA